MADSERLLKAKIPCEETGIEIKRSMCDICSPSAHCGVDVYVKDGKIIKLEGTKDHPVNHGLLCAKGQAGRQYVYRSDRIKTPLRRVGARGSGDFEPITWEEAYQEIGKRLLAIKSESGPEAVAFIAGYEKWLRPFLRRFAYSFGSPNYGTESSTCSTAAILAWVAATGNEKAKPDLSGAGVYLGFGYSGYHSSYLYPSAVDAARKRGMKLIVIDPRRTFAAETQSDLFLQIRPGTDGVLAMAMANLLIKHGWVDHDYIRNHVHGFEEYAEYVKAFDIAAAERITGIPAEKIEQAVRMIRDNAPAAIHESAAPILHHRNGFQNYRAISALSALLGTFDRPGGQLPAELTFVNSVSGFRTKEDDFTGKRPDAEMIGQRRFPLWAEVTGEMQVCDLSRQILEKTPYPVRAVFALGLNYRMVNDSQLMKRALSELDFFVNADLFLTDTAKLADIVLPACSSFERSELKTYPKGYVFYTKPAIMPLYESKPDTEILKELADSMVLPDELLRAGYEDCVRYIFSNTVVDIDELKDSPVPVHYPELKPPPPGQFQFKTPTGKFELHATILDKYADAGLDPLPTYTPSPDGADEQEFPMLLLSGGGRLPFALHSRLHDVPWLRYCRPAPMADISHEDAGKLGIQSGDEVVISSAHGKVRVKACPSSRIMPGLVHLYHDYPDADGSSLMGPTHNDPYSGFPGYNSIRCRINKDLGGDKK